MKKLSLSLSLVLTLMITFSCGNDDDSSSEFTGNEVRMEMIPGTVQGNTTTGTILIRERSNGQAQLEISLNNVLNNADHPVHLHLGSLDDDGDVVLLLERLTEENGIGRSVTLLDALDDNTTLNYTNFLNFDGSIKIHFEDSGPLENEILGAVNIGINTSGNQAYLDGVKSIATCNSDFAN
ncbi:hypothetical protein BFP97_03635 [Roseivirga sp. 4D4]|uniref:hypothetical protein n=1 Tax=Roseivirga sp. 4D4 TaxID=1889784 RepID=UPI0008536B71|nr:hypothetical protein [Roseivirga sp. 4D4]OEK00652.1 hypothetical protein BFP97_03635 [Roseivirga sp. 4D4]